MELTRVERQIILALEVVGPCGLSPLLPKCPALESKVALKNLLAQLDHKGAVKLQSNNQYSVVKPWMKEAREHGWLTAPLPKTTAKPADAAAIKKASVPVARISFAEQDVPVFVESKEADASLQGDSDSVLTINYAKEADASLQGQADDPIVVSIEHTEDPIASLMRALPYGVQIGVNCDGVSINWHGLKLEPSVEELPNMLSAITTLQPHIVIRSDGQAM